MEPFIFEFAQYVQKDMLDLIRMLPWYVQTYGTPEICTTYTEWHEGVWYVVNLCVERLADVASF